MFIYYLEISEGYHMAQLSFQAPIRIFKLFQIFLTQLSFTNTKFFQYDTLKVILSLLSLKR